MGARRGSGRRGGAAACQARKLAGQAAGWRLLMMLGVRCRFRTGHQARRPGGDPQGTKVEEVRWRGPPLPFLRVAAGQYEYSGGPSSPVASCRSTGAGGGAAIFPALVRRLLVRSEHPTRRHRHAYFFHQSSIVLTSRPPRSGYSNKQSLTAASARFALRAPTKKRKEKFDPPAVASPAASVSHNARRPS